MTGNATMRPELLTATDEEITDAVGFAEPMVLRAIVYQLTGDEEVVDIVLEPAGSGIFERMVPKDSADVEMLRRKAVDLLKEYRDSGAGPMPIGPRERLATSLRLAVGVDLDEDAVALGLEELSIDPWVRSLELKKDLPAEKLAGFSVTVIGAGMAGLNTAVQLKRAGIPFTVVEKNDGVGGTWFENHYPGARVDTASRSYTHIFGVDFPYPYSFCPSDENKKYFDWIADSFGVRENIVFNTEVTSLTWHEDRAMWEVVTDGPEGPARSWSNAVVTAVGFLNRPKVAEFPGAEDFEGESWHTSRWPDDVDLTGKRVAVIGTGSTGYQLTPDLALLAEHVTVFQRTPGWLLNVPNYRNELPDQVTWLDRNMPFHTNFMRYRATRSTWMLASIAEIDPDFDDPDACNEANKRTRDACIAFLEEKVRDPELVARLTPRHPVLASRAIVVDPEYSFLDAIQRDDVTLVSGGINKITPTGVEADNGQHYEVDVIVYATGFHATEYLFPMEVTGRDGVTVNDLWKDEGARAYLGLMLPGFPNLFTIYGPNTNGGLPPAAIGELSTLYLLRCAEKLLIEDKSSVTVRREAYDRWADMIDERNRRKVWSDPRAHNYYWTEFGRSATMNPLFPSEMWRALRKPDFSELEVR